MNTNLHLLITLLFCIGVVYPAYPQLDIQPRDHIIILVDGGTHTFKKRQKPNIQRLIKKIEDKCTKEGALIPNETILNKGDYMSFLSFSMKEGDNISFSNFFHTNEEYIKESGWSDKPQEFGFLNKEYLSKDIFDNITSNINKSKHFLFNSRWSLDATAKALIYSHINDSKNNPLVNRVFLFVISNDIETPKYANYEAEIKKIAKDKQIKGFESKIKEIRENSENKFDERELGEKIQDGRMTLYSYQYSPESEFNVTSLYTISDNIELGRGREHYNAKFVLHTKDNSSDKYLIKKVNIILVDKNNPQDTLFNESIIQDVKKELTFDIPLTYNAKGKELIGKVNFWVQKKDKVFNSFVFSPYDTDTIVSGKLSKDLNITFRSNARILGIFPMPNGMYQLAVGATSWIWGESDRRCVWLWNIIFGGILLWLFSFISITKLQMNVDKGKEAKIEREPNEEAKEVTVDFNNISEGFNDIKNNKEILVTEKKRWLWWKYKVNYKHHYIETIIERLPLNLKIDEENLVLFKTQYIENETPVSRIENLEITSKVKKFEIGLSHLGIKDFYNFDDKRSSQKIEKLNFKVQSLAQKGQNATFANYFLDLIIKKESASFVLEFENNYQQGLDYNDKLNNLQIGTLLLKNETEKAFAETIHLDSISIDDNRIQLNIKDLKSPYIYTIDGNVLILLLQQVEESEKAALENRLSGANFLTEEEFREAIAAIKVNNEEELIKKAKKKHPLFYSKEENGLLELVIPGKTTIAIPVMIDVSKFGNPKDEKEKITFEINCKKGKEPIKQSFSLFLNQNKSYSELDVLVIKGNSISELGTNIKFPALRSQWSSNSTSVINHFSIEIKNKAQKHGSNEPITLKNVNFRFEVEPYIIIPKTDEKSIFLVELNKAQSKYNYGTQSYLNKQEVSTFNIRIDYNQISEIKQKEVKVKCILTYQFKGKEFSHEIEFQINKALGENWLALDLGTSAIVAAFTNDVYLDNPDDMLLDLHDSLYHIFSQEKDFNIQEGFYRYNSDNIEEFDKTSEEVTEIVQQHKVKPLGHLISSSIILNQGGRLDGKEYTQNIINISPTISKIKNETRHIIPYLKSLIGKEEFLTGRETFEYYESSVYYYRQEDYTRLENEIKDHDLKHYLQEIKKELGTKKYPQKIFESKLKRIFKSNALFEKYQYQLIGAFELPEKKILEQLETTSPNYETVRNILATLRNKKYAFYSDYVFVIKNLLKQGGKTLDIPQISKLFLDRENRNKIAQVDLGRKVKHEKNEMTENFQLKITTMLQNTYESIFRDFIYPQIQKRVGNNDNIGSILNKVVLSYPNTFSPLHIKYIREDIILSQFTEFDNDHIKFISESDAIAVYYAGKIYKKQQKREQEYVLVYDMGAGTLDITYFVIDSKSNKIQIDIIGKSGKTTAGNYLDRILAEHIYNENKDKFQNRELFSKEKNSPTKKEHSIILKNYIRNIVKPNLYKKTGDRKQGDDKIRAKYEQLSQLLKLKEVFAPIESVYKQYEQQEKEYNLLLEELDSKQSTFDQIKSDESNIQEYQAVLEKINGQEKLYKKEVEQMKRILKEFNYSNLESSTFSAQKDVIIQHINNDYEAYKKAIDSCVIYDRYKEYEQQIKAFEEYGADISDITDSFTEIKSINSELNHVLQEFKVSSYDELIDKLNATFSKSNAILNEILQREKTSKDSLDSFYRKKKASIKKFDAKLNDTTHFIKSNYNKNLNRDFDSFLEYIKQGLKNISALESEVASKKDEKAKNEHQIAKLQTKINFISDQKGITKDEKVKLDSSIDKLNKDMKVSHTKLSSLLDTSNKKAFQSRLLAKEKSIRDLENQIEITISLNDDFRLLGEQMKKIESNENIIFVAKGKGEIGKIVNESFSIDLSKVNQSEVVKKYIKQNTQELMTEFYNIYKGKIEPISGLKNEFPVDKIILAGRGSQLKGIKDELTGLFDQSKKSVQKQWTNSKDVEFTTFDGASNDLKTIVANGALYYALTLNENGENQQIKIKNDNLNAIYGVIYKRQDKWGFLPLLSPGMQPINTQPIEIDGFQLNEYFNTASFDFNMVTQFMLVQSYVTDPIKYRDENGIWNDEYFTIVKPYKVADYGGAQGIGIEINIHGKLSFYFYDSLNYSINPSRFANGLRGKAIPEHIIDLFEKGEKVNFSDKGQMEKYIKSKLGKNDLPYSEALLQSTLPQTVTEAAQLEMSKLNDTTSSKTFQYSLWPYL